MDSKHKQCMKNTERGASLIALSIFLLVIGLLSIPAFKIIETWSAFEDSAETVNKINEIQKSLDRFFVENGRYPCPAPLTAPVDSAEFARSVLADCTASNVAGTFRAAGRDGQNVRTGAVPVRTLGLSDNYVFDDYNNRYVYSVTEIYAVEGDIARGDRGAIYIEDMSGNNATAEAGNIVHTVFSTGGDPNGAYDFNGNLVQACDTSRPSGENCDYATNATFTNSIFKSTREDNYFVHQISYTPSKTARPCVEDTTSGIKRPKDVAFIIDTSGSMSGRPIGGSCPAHMSGCSRIDVARWALRRVVPAHLNQNHISDDPGKTSMTGFVGTGSASNIERNMGDIGFDDPGADGYTPPDPETVSDRLESRLQGMCPSGLTPLGTHIQVVADRLGDGTPDRPNKITILSDGVSNNGIDPVQAARDVIAKYPNMQIDIVDVEGTPSLREVAELTGGKYYRSDNADALLENLQSSIGLCEPPPPTAPAVDRRGCGSSGRW